MGGLVAARVLSDFYESVTVVERDLLPPDAENRRGVPQGRHVHAMLGHGTEVLAELFRRFHRRAWRGRRARPRLPRHVRGGPHSGMTPASVE